MRRLIAILCCMLCCWAGFAQQHNPQQLEKLTQACQYINNNYVDDLDLEPLVAEAIDSALKELDPHSSYLSQEEFATMYEGIKGEFSGIGINFITLRDTVIVTRNLVGSPPQSAGLKKNDRRLSVNDTANTHVETLNNTLGRYIILSLTYRFGKFKGAKGGPQGGPGMGRPGGMGGRPGGFGGPPRF